MPDLARHSRLSDEWSEIGELFDLLASRPAWHARAACRTAPPGLTWFPGQGTDTDPIKAVCAACPARDDCRAWALEQDGNLYGTWGGTSEAERRRLRRAAA